MFFAAIYSLRLYFISFLSSEKILFEKQKNMQKESNNTSEYEEKNGVILELSNSLEKQIDKTQSQC